MVAKIYLILEHERGKIQDCFAERKKIQDRFAERIKRKD